MRLLEIGKLKQNRYSGRNIQILESMTNFVIQLLYLSRCSGTDAIGISVLSLLILVSMNDESVPGGKFSEQYVIANHI